MRLVLESFCLNSWRLNTLRKLLWSRYEQRVWSCKRNENLKTDCESYKLYHTKHLIHKAFNYNRVRITTWEIGNTLLNVTLLTAMFVGSRGTRWSCQWRIRKWILFEAFGCWVISPSINCLHYVGGLLFRSEFSKITFFRTFRSNHQRYSVRKSVLRNFAKFTEKHLCQSLCFNKVSSLNRQIYWKRDSGTGVFLWIFRNFQEHLF